MKTRTFLMAKWFAAALMVGFAFNANAQTRYTCDLATSTVLVKGTSTLHDWEMKATEFSAWALAESKGNDLIEITDGAATFKSNKILSESSGMDNKAHDALKTSKFPEITFKVTGPSQLGLTNQKGQLKGELTICGVKKTVVVPASLLAQGPNKWLLTANMKFKMSDYGVTPPTALMGTVKSGDEITMEFKMTFKK